MTDAPGILFDLDGTLVDTLIDITDALNAALARRGAPRAEPRQVRGWIGRGVTELCRRAAPSADDAAVAALRDAMLQAYADGCLRASRLYPGVRETLEELHRCRVPMAVLSNKPDALTVRIMRTLCAPTWFVAVRGARGEQERKPFPGVALELARRLGRAPGAVYFLGDSLTDIETARNAGMRAAAVTWGYGDPDALRGAAPAFLLERPADALRLPGLCVTER